MIKNKKLCIVFNFNRLTIQTYQIFKVIDPNDRIIILGTFAWLDRVYLRLIVNCYDDMEYVHGIIVMIFFFFNVPLIPVIIDNFCSCLVGPL